MKNKFIELLKPNGKVHPRLFLYMAMLQLFVVATIWFSSDVVFLPTPIDIVKAMVKMITTDDLIHELATSTILSLQATGITVAIGLLVSYLTVIPFFRPLAYIVTKGRYLSLVGLSFTFMMIFNNGEQLKVFLLVSGMIVFFVTSMVAEIQAIPKAEYDHARTLGMSEFEVVWHVVVMGRLHSVFEISRQNFAIAWMMLTMVEGISRSEGGIGVVLLNQSKYLRMDSVFAIQILILAVGMLLDYLFGVLNEIVNPHAKITLERK